MRDLGKRQRRFHHDAAPKGGGGVAVGVVVAPTGVPPLRLAGGRRCVARACGLGMVGGCVESWDGEGRVRA